MWTEKGFPNCAQYKKVFIGIDIGWSTFSKMFYGQIFVKKSRTRKNKICVWNRGSSKVLMVFNGVRKISMFRHKGGRGR